MKKVIDSYRKYDFTIVCLMWGSSRYQFHLSGQTFKKITFILLSDIFNNYKTCIANHYAFSSSTKLHVAKTSQVRWL